MIHGNIDIRTPPLTGIITSNVPILNGYISTTEVVKEVPMEYQETTNMSGGKTVYIGKERGD